MRCTTVTIDIQVFLPEASFGLQVLSSPASVCVCVKSVCQSLACPRDNSGPVQARVKLGSPNLDQRCKIPWLSMLRSLLFGGHLTLTFKVELNINLRIYPIWACPHHNPLSIQARSTKFGPDVENSLVKVPAVLGGNWPWPSRSNLISKVEFSYLTTTENI